MEDTPQRGGTLLETRDLAMHFGGVAALDDLRQVKGAGLAGAIVGRALYDGRFTLAEALACVDA